MSKKKYEVSIRVIIEASNDGNAIGAFWETVAPEIYNYEAHVEEYTDRPSAADSEFVNRHTVEKAAIEDVRDVLSEIQEGHFDIDDVERNLKDILKAYDDVIN